MHYVIGCGGVGSWLVPKLTKFASDITVVDGDVLEKGNLDRQFFSEDQIGTNKAVALGEKYDSIEFTVDQYFGPGLDLGLTSDDILFCCADNNACRRHVLEACDLFDCRCAIGANEYTDAEAYWYEASWKDTPNDPRVFYPVILTDQSGDPLGPPGCTGVAQERTPQLVLANDWASGMMLHLFWFHTEERAAFRDFPDSWPVHHKVNKFAFKTIKKGERT